MQNKQITELPEGLIFQPMIKNEWRDYQSRLSTGSQVFTQQAYVVRQGQLVPQRPALVRGMISAEAK